MNPLVENAVLHGLSNKVSGGKIIIQGKNKGSAIDISVFDNGCGMTKHELQQLRNDLSSSGLFETKCLGLKNINQRVRIKFGPQYGLRVLSKSGYGSSVHIALPII